MDSHRWNSVWRCKKDVRGDHGYGFSVGQVMSGNAISGWMLEMCRDLYKEVNSNWDIYFEEAK